jgi:DNA-binding NtrC family response regulator
VRELANRVQRAVLVQLGEAIGPADLGLAVGAGGRIEARRPTPGPLPLSGPAIPTSSPPTDAATDLASETERASIEEALVRAGGVVAKAAAEMGLSRQALYRRMERLGIVMERRPK